LIMKNLIIIAVLCLSSVVAAEDFNPSARAVWNGQVYTPSSFPRAKWCGMNGACPMCESIRSQWRAWSAPKVVVSTPIEDDEYETKYRIEKKTVTKYRREAYQRKVCTGGLFPRCYFVTDYRDVPYTETVDVKVPYKVKKQKAIEPPPKPIPEPSIQVRQKLLPTPLSAIRRLFTRLDVRNSVVIDAGSGDGRFLIEATNHGCRAIGVEIDPMKVRLSRQRIRASGSKAIVFEGDALTFDYSAADIIYIYQYPDLMEKIVKRLPRGKRVVSYMHPIPGVECKSYSVGDGQTFYVGVVGGIVEKKHSLTFGL
jgi:hypothetical protein